MSARTEAALHRAEERAAKALLRAAEACAKLASELQLAGQRITIDHDVIVTGSRCRDLGGYLDQRVTRRSLPR